MKGEWVSRGGNWTVAVTMQFQPSLFTVSSQAPRCHSLRSYRCWTHLCSLSVFGFQMLVMSQWLFQTSHWLLRILSLSVPPADSGSCQVSASKNTGRFWFGFFPPLSFQNVCHWEHSASFPWLWSLLLPSTPTPQGLFFFLFWSIWYYRTRRTSSVFFRVDQHVDFYNQPCFA